MLDEKLSAINVASLISPFPSSSPEYRHDLSPQTVFGRSQNDGDAVTFYARLGFKAFPAIEVSGRHYRTVPVIQILREPASRFLLWVS